MAVRWCHVKGTLQRRLTYIFSCSIKSLIYHIFTHKIWTSNFYRNGPEIWSFILTLRNSDTTDRLEITSDLPPARWRLRPDRPLGGDFVLTYRPLGGDFVYVDNYVNMASHVGCSACSNTYYNLLHFLSYTIRYDSVYLTCSKKLTGSQLSLPHGTKQKIKMQN